jgi:hypothetical protein
VHSNHTLLYVIAWGDGEWKNELEWTKRLEGRDVLSMVNNNWRRKKRRRREEKKGKERGNGFHRVGEDRMIIQRDFNG